MLRILFVFILLMPNLLLSQTRLNLIPYPQSVKINDGEFVLDSETKIIGDKNSFEVQYFINQVKNTNNISLSFSEKYRKKDKKIHIGFYRNCRQPNEDNQEKYSILVSGNDIYVLAYNSEALFHGIQTLLQLIPSNSNSSAKIPNVEITDFPKFQWRGMHLDVCRHFFSVDEVKKYIDYLALYKFNTFHWHLTDDQGWRIEIKKYPKLTEIGSKRKETMKGAYANNEFDGTPYGGFYTQEQIKDVVAYAEKRHINIIPEIEMPGHALAALAAYPELACTKGPFETATKWGVFDDVFCPKEETFSFLENVLDEVMQLFPSKIIHIGGDECPKTRWKESQFCQDLIKKYDLKDEHGLQSYFIQRIEKYLNSKGRKIIGWDEILEGGLAPNALVMSWRGTQGGIAAAKSKHFAVMSPGEFCYFDHYQGDKNTEPLAFPNSFTSMEKVYSYNPIPKELSAEESKFILGTQANLWTEYIPNFAQVEYMIFPRMMALSEVAWGTSDPGNYQGFRQRVISQFPMLDKMKINYSKVILKE